MGLEVEMERILKRYNTNMDPEQEPEMELTIYDLRWDIDGTGGGDGVSPQMYNTNMYLEMELTPHIIWCET